NPRPSASKERHKPTLLMKLRRGRKSKKPRPSESASPAIEHFRLTMTEQDAAQIILVRSLEEIDPKTFPPSRLSEALTAVGSDLRPSSWFLTRARYLLSLFRIPMDPSFEWRNFRQAGRSPFAAFPAHRLGDNYLGSFTKIPILLNPQAAKPIALHRFWD